MAKNLVITEFLAEAEFYSTRTELLNAQTKILSLLPESSLFWKGKGIAFETSVPYFSKKSHEACLSYVDKTIRRVNQLASIEDADGIRHAYTNALTCYLRHYLSYVALTVETLGNFIEQNPAAKLHAGVYKDNDHSQYVLYAKERVMGEIAQKFAGRIEVETSALNIPDELKPHKHQHRLRSLFYLACFHREIKRIRPGQTPSLFFYSLKFNLDHMARNFKNLDFYKIASDKKTLTKLVDDSSGFDVHQVHLPDWGRPDDVFKHSWETTVRKIYEAHHDQKIFTYRDIDCSDIIFRKFALGYGPELLRLNRQTRYLKKFLTTLKPAAALAPMARDISYTLGEMCSLLKIPSALISHGSHVPPHNAFEEMEWRDHAKGLVDTDYQYHLLQSPWAVKHVQAMGYPRTYHCIHPLVFSAVDRSDREDKRRTMVPQAGGKKIIMHAGTPKPRGSNRLYIYETLDEYVEYMAHLVEATRDLPDAFLILRFRPYPYLSAAQLKALLPPGDHYTVASEGSFGDYLKIADLVVSFSSTTIEEALISRVPVLQYDASNRYLHIDGARWKDKGFAHVDSVYYIGDREFLRPGVDWIIRNHLNATTVGDLFERHVFGPDEAVRAEEFIERVLKRDVPPAVEKKDSKHLNLGDMYDR